MKRGRVVLFALTALVALARPPRARAAAASAPTAPGFDARSTRFAADLRAWYMDGSAAAESPPFFSTSEADAQPAAITDLLAVRGQAALIKLGRWAQSDAPQAYADMTVLVARRLGIQPPEAALAVYRGRLRPAAEPPTPAEEAVRAELAAAARAPDVSRRCVYIADLVGAPAPPTPTRKTRVVYVRTRRGRRIRRVIRPPEMAPPPQPVSVLAQVDWRKADALAAVAEGNARGWNRRPRESRRRYRRRLRRMRSHCYEWVRRDLAALGLWDRRLFRDDVPATRRDRMRPIRAASFALAMAKVVADRPLAAETSLRQLNLRVDPLVRGSIVVFSQSVCGYSRRSGHIEIITSVDPLRAASYKFHPVDTACLVKASNEDKVHIYVPLLPDATTADAPAPEAARPPKVQPG